MTNNRNLVQIFRLIAVTLTLLFLIGGAINLISKRAIPITLAESTATLTASPSATATERPAATATITVEPTDTATSEPTATTTPSNTATATDTATPTLTATSIISDTATPTEPPATNTTTTTATLLATTAISGTDPLTATLTPTPSGPPTQTPTPTITPTPVPRTVLANNVPDHTLAQSHLWFARPFSNENSTWGSAFYPYGTNADGLYLWHHGIDIQNSAGTPILAVGDGQVIFAGSDATQAVGPQTNFYGQAVIIQHGRSLSSTNESETLPVYTLYGHMQDILVQEGDSVETGQPIALTGQEGIALGPHLHLEVRVGQNGYSRTQNPDLWIRPDAGHGVIAGRVIDVNGYYVPQQLITLHVAATPNRFWRQTRSYPDNRYAFDAQLGETFTFSDVPVGDYIVKTFFDNRVYDLPVTVRNQEVSFVLIQGQAAPTPTAVPTETPAAETTDDGSNDAGSTAEDTLPAPDTEATPTPTE